MRCIGSLCPHCFTSSAAQTRFDGFGGLVLHCCGQFPTSAVGQFHQTGSSETKEKSSREAALTTSPFYSGVAHLLFWLHWL